MRRNLAVCLVSLLTALVVASAPAAARPVAARAASCEQRVTFALTDARTSGCFTQTSTDPATWTSTDAFTLNGIPMQAAPGTQLQLTGPTSGSPGGSIGVRTRITILGATIFDGSFDHDLPAGGPGDLKQLVMLSAPSGLKIKGFSVGGSITLQMGRDAAGEQQGYTRIELILALPNIFKNGPGQDAGGLTGTVAIRADAAGVHADTLKIEVTNAYVGQLLLKNVCLSYISSTSPTPPCSPPPYGAGKLLECGSDSGADRWDGSALITLPTASRPDVGLFAGTSDGQFAYAGATVTNLGTSVPLATAVYLDRVGIGLCLKPPPLRVKGSATIRFGPDFNGTQAASLTGTIEYTDSRPWVIAATGRLTLFGYDLANSYFTYRSSGAIDFGFNAKFNFSHVFSVSGGVNGWYQPAETVRTCSVTAVVRIGSHSFNLAVPVACTDSNCQRAGAVCRNVTRPAAFNVDGNGEICVASVACASGEVAVSTKGVAGCFTIASFAYPYLTGKYYDPSSWHYETRHKRLRAGAGYRWSGHIALMGDSCDVGPYREVRTASVSAAGVRVLRLGASDAVVLRIRGRGASPRVEVTGPHGRRITSPKQSGAIRKGHYVIAEDRLDGTTEVLIVKPAAGDWKIRPLRGSAPIIGIRQAPSDAPPEIMAGVRGRQQARLLGYAYMPEHNHTMAFVERGRTYEQPIAPATGRPCKHEPGFARAEGWLCGSADFVPAPGPAGRRRIYALIYDEHGLLLREQLIATYTYGGEGRPARPTNLRIHRSATNVTINWSPVSGAADYDVDITLSNGSKVLDVTGARHRHVVLHGIARSLGITVSVSGVRHDDVSGPGRHATSPGR